MNRNQLLLGEIGKDDTARPFARAALTVGVYLLVFGVGYLDYVTGPEIGLSLFYFLPIMMGSWYFYERRVSPIVIPCLSAVVWLLADIFSSHRYSGIWIPYWNMFIRLGMFIIISLTISRLRQSHYNEQILSRTDALTGAVNSRYFSELVAREISHATRFSEPFSFAFIDIDNFKNVNDTFGHHQGDELLRALTGAIRANIRTIDILVRLGGDEFGILFPRTDATQGRAAMKKVDSIVRRHISSTWKVTLSAGVVTFRTPPKSWDEMVRAADALMYKAKKDGKDRVAFEVVT
jgi:diguanylate cyclase (GGDEF)-like protein